MRVENFGTGFHSLVRMVTRGNGRKRQRSYGTVRVIYSRFINWRFWSMIKAIFKGDATLFMAGIPARDLTADEWNEVKPELQEKALHLGLYEVIEVSSDEQAEG